MIRPTRLAWMLAAAVVVFGLSAPDAPAVSLLKFSGKLISITAREYVFEPAAVDGASEIRIPRKAVSAKTSDVLSRSMGQVVTFDVAASSLSETTRRRSRPRAPTRR